MKVNEISISNGPSNVTSEGKNTAYIPELVPEVAYNNNNNVKVAGGGL